MFRSADASVMFTLAVNTTLASMFVSVPVIAKLVDVISVNALSISTLAFISELDPTVKDPPSTVTDAASISTFALISTFAFNMVLDPTVSEPPSTVTVAESISTFELTSNVVPLIWNIVELTDVLDDVELICKLLLATNASPECVMLAVANKLPDCTVFDVMLRLAVGVFVPKCVAFAPPAPLKLLETKVVFDKKKPLTYALPIVPPPTFEVRVVTTTFSIS